MIWSLDTVHQALLIHASYVYLVINYNNPSSVYDIAPTLKVCFNVIMITTLLTKMIITKVVVVINVSVKNTKISS